MEATKQQIANIFNGHRILEVPYYQRSYVWHEDNGSVSWRIWHSYHTQSRIISWDLSF